jgi:uncharacterized CHY-type Zn-finger protein
MYMGIYFRLFFKIIYSTSPSNNKENDSHLRFTNCRGNSLVVGFAIIILDSDDLIFLSEFLLEIKQWRSLCPYSAIRLSLYRIWSCVRMSVTLEDIEERNNAIKCQLCQRYYDFKNLYPVFHHHHFARRLNKFPNGREVQIICNLCNFKIVKSPIVAISYDLKAKDARTIIRSLKPEYLKNLRIFAKSSEEILSLTLFNCRIVESCRKLALNRDI